MSALDVAVLVAELLVLAAAIAYVVILRLRASTIEQAAREALEMLRTQQIAEDRGALRSLPPTVAADEAIERAARLGISVEEAAEQIFLARARALLSARMRTSIRHTRRHP